MGTEAFPELTAKGDSTFLVASLGARYFFDRNLSAIGSLNLGISTLHVGMDYRF